MEATAKDEEDIVDLHVDDSLRLCVGNVSKHHGRTQCREAFQKMGVVHFKSVNKMKGQSVAFVSVNVHVYV